MASVPFGTESLQIYLVSGQSYSYCSFVQRKGDARGAHEQNRGEVEYKYGLYINRLPGSQGRIKALWA